MPQDHPPTFSLALSPWSSRRRWCRPPAATSGEPMMLIASSPIAIADATDVWLPAVVVDPATAAASGQSTRLRPPRVAEVGEQLVLPVRLRHLDADVPIILWEQPEGVSLPWANICRLHHVRHTLKRVSRQAPASGTRKSAPIDPAVLDCPVPPPFPTVPHWLNFATTRWCSQTIAASFIEKLRQRVKGQPIAARPPIARRKSATRIHARIATAEIATNDRSLMLDIPISSTESASELRARATRTRRHAIALWFDEAAPKLLALANEFDAQADAMER